MESAKQEAMKLLSLLPNEITWQEILYEMYVRKKIQEGEEDIENDRVVSHEDILRKYLQS